MAFASNYTRRVVHSTSQWRAWPENRTSFGPRSRAERVGSA